MAVTAQKITNDGCCVVMRADLFLFANGLAPSRETAKKLILGGCVWLNGKKLAKPSADIGEGTVAADVTVIPLPDMRYVGRGGLKLEAALDAFGVSVDGVKAIDIGASTGGFTDCLLSRGAAYVTAVDSGHGQLAAKLEADPRVRSLEGINARYMTADIVGAGYDIAVMDVSFISQTLILPTLPPLLRDGGRLISLIKPQFEVGRADVGKGGIVRSQTARLRAVRSVIDTAEGVGFRHSGTITSPITGGDGNIEYLVCFVLFRSVAVGQ